jgi:hypothetical protein
MGADVSGCGFRSGGVALPVGEQGLGFSQLRSPSPVMQRRRSLMASGMTERMVC